MIEQIESTWGSGAVMAGRTGTYADDRGVREQLARFERQSATPGAAAALVRMAGQIDVTAICGMMSVSTLILHRREDPSLSVEASRELHRLIPNSRYVELEGAEHMPWVGNTDAVLEEIEEFITALRQGPEVDRILSTVLFTDIVDSTKTAARLGDRKWRDLLDDHDAIIRREAERFRGRVIKSTGDGALAIFGVVHARAVRCATAIRDALAAIGLQVRAGVHTGEIELRGDDVGGVSVHVGARVGALAGPGEVLVTATVTALVGGSGLAFKDHGTHTLKGVPGEWQVFALDEGPRASDQG